MSSTEKMKKLIEISEKFLEYTVENMDYHAIARNVLQLSDAKYVVFSLFDEDGKGYTSLSLASRNNIVPKITKLIGFSPEGRHWPFEPEKFQDFTQETFFEIKDIHRVVEKNFSPGVRKIIFSVLNIGKSYYLKISNKDKRIGSFLILMSPGDEIKDTDLLEVYGRQTGLLLERIKSEKELRESEEQFKSYSANAPFGLFIYDFEKEKVTEANEMSMEMLGYSYQELTNMTAMDFFPQSSHEEIQFHMEKVLENGEDYIEVEMLTKNGGRIFTGINGVKLSSTRIMGFARDITEDRLIDEELKHMNVMKSALLDNTSQLFFLIDRNMMIIDYNKRSEILMKKIYGIDLYVGSSIREFFKEKDEEFFNDLFSRAFSGEMIKDEFFVEDREGKELHIEANLNPVYDEKKGEVWAISFTCYDITDLKNIEKALRISEERFKYAALSTSDIIYELDVNDNSLTWFGEEEKFANFGLPMYPKTLRGWITCLHPEDQNKLISLTRKDKANRKPYTGEYRLIGSEGKTIYVEDYSVGIYDEDNHLKKVVGAITNISTRKYFEEQLKFFSYYDQLTEVNNRSFFEEEIKRIKKMGTYPISIIVIDLDGLKLVNDTMGHYLGDQQLKEVAGILKKSIREGDLLARTGGDEFAIILEKGNEKIAEKTLEKIICNIEIFNKKESTKIPLSISVGMASSSDKVNLEELFKRADDFMYRNKLSKGNSAKSQIINSLMATLAERDYITEGHASRLSAICVAMGHRLRLTSQEINNLNLLSKVHDLGKVGVPDNILFKPGPLTPEEWDIMKLHPEKGFRIAISSPDLAGIADLILKHHERWDGKGYPVGMKEKDIPLECRILSVVDTYDAIVNDRPYCKARTREEAIEEIKRNSGTQFDPDIVKVFLEIIEEVS